MNKLIITALILLSRSVTSAYDRRVITSLKYSRYRVKPTIVNGDQAKSGQVPYLVSLKEPASKVDTEMRVWKNLCGGTIIGETKVLTAAHCFESNDFYYAKNPGKLRVVAGSLLTDMIHVGDANTGLFAQWRNIKKIIIHKDFNFPANDIALVFVKTPWRFTDYVDYAILAHENIDYPTTCVTAGYGRIGYGKNDKKSPMLLIARISTLARSRCSSLWEMNMDHFICTDSVVRDVSRGDSGGPLSCHGTIDVREMPDRDLVVGIVCGKNFDKTTIFTRVSAYKDWIKKNNAQSLIVNYNLYLTIILLIVIYLLFCLIFTKEEVCSEAG